MSPDTRDVDRITIEGMAEAIQRSGYLIEQRLGPKLLERGFYPQTNAAYPDESTGRSRELDIYAMSAIEIGHKHGYALFPVLLCECVNNPQPIAFFTKPHLYIPPDSLQISGIPTMVLGQGPDRWLCLAELLKVERFHHYFKEDVATQYCSFQKKRDGEWMATHSDEHHSAFETLRMALESDIEDHYRDWTANDVDGINLQLYYPLLVVRGDLYRVSEEDEELKFTEVNRVLFQMEHHSATRHETYFVDVIAEKAFDEYMTVVEYECGRIAYRLMRNNHRIPPSIEALATKAAAEPDTPIRKILHWGE